MAKPAFNQIKRHLANEKAVSDGQADGQKAKAMVFVADRKQARLTALDLVTFITCEEDSSLFLGAEMD